MNEDVGPALAALDRVLDECVPAALALSGGVDSMTLAARAHGRLGAAVRMYHATSPAVPAEATRRVRAFGARHGWSLHVFEAGEFDDPDYRANPVNRCFYCKTRLYAAVCRVTDATVLSGANLDDLGDYRPGLDAARNFRVRHPYVEAGIDKRTVRAIARHLGLGALAELPSQPCLSSRVETGIRIQGHILSAVHAAERLVGARLAPDVVRCRVRRRGVFIELDEASLERLLPRDRRRLGANISALFAAAGLECAVDFAPYRTGSAFLHPGGGP